MKKLPRKKNTGRMKVPDKTRPKGRAEKTREDAETGFPIVGVGASAGGLEAFTELLKSLPSNTGMAFILV